MNVLNGLREAFRDEARDKVCDVLQNMGIIAKMSERGRPEENIELLPICKSLGIIDIAEGPIKWINAIRKQVGHVTEYFFKYGVPDSRLSPSLPQIKIEAVPKYQFRLFGKITDLKWESPFYLSLINGRTLSGISTSEGISLKTSSIPLCSYSIPPRLLLATEI